MSFQPLNTSNSLESNFSQVNNLMTDFKNQQQTNIFKDDTGTPVVILNKDGLKTTAPGAGIDVTTATNAQYTFNSQQNVFKILTSGTTSVTSTGSNSVGSANIDLTSFGLTSPPAVIGFLGSSSIYNPLPAIVQTSFSGGFINIQGYVSLSQITNTGFSILYSKSSAGSATYSVKYYVLQETAS